MLNSFSYADVYQRHIFFTFDFNFCDLLKIQCGLSKITQKQVAFIL